MTIDSAANRIRRYVIWHVVIWKFGGARERALFLLLIVVVYLLLPGAVAWFFISGSRLEFPWEFYVMIGITITNLLFLVDLFSIALYTAESWERMLALGQFSPKEDVALQYLQYLRTHGDGKRLQGTVRLAWLGWTLFFGLFLLSIAFGLLLLPLVGPPTPALFFAVNAPAVLLFRRFWRKKQPILFGLPDSTGVRISPPAFSKRH